MVKDDLGAVTREVKDLHPGDLIVQVEVYDITCGLVMALYRSSYLVPEAQSEYLTVHILEQESFYKIAIRKKTLAKVLQRQ